MQTQPNSRQFPSDKKSIEDKKLHDILYLLLQSLSEWDGNIEHNRFILKKNLNKSKLSKACGYKSRQTIYTHLNHLISQQYLLDLDDRYEFPLLKNGEYFLIPYETALFLVNTQKYNVIKTYIYLSMRWISNGNSPYEVSHKQICDAIGLYWDDQNNRDTVSSILLTLHNNFLITISSPHYSNGVTMSTVSHVDNIVRKREA